MKPLLALLILMLIVILAFATPYVPPDRITTHYGHTLFEVPPAEATFNHLFEFNQISAFEQPLQCEVPGSNWGGQREEESGYYYNIIETDNTLEAIWLWSRYYELTGNPQYNDEIADAWIYAYTYPAWLEGAGYYSAHNCAWGLAAELKFRTVFNDSSHWDYAVNCANYIIQTPLPFDLELNVMVTGWCCGNLYLYGEATNNETYMQIACARGRQITNWVEQSPTTRLALESWAMSSGTFVWGVCNSYFREDPTTGQTWLATYGPMVQVYEPSGGGWSNAWNVAYCNAQGGMYDVTGNQTYGDNHLSLTNLLLRFDSDNDGGIPASSTGTVDASWTSSYLAMMACNRYLGTPVDAGVLFINSPRNNSRLTLGNTIPVTATVGNWGTSVLNNVMVTMSGAYQDTQWVNLNPGQNLLVNFGSWTPTEPGIDSMWATIYAPGDTIAFNNTDISRFYVRSVYGSEGVDLASVANIAKSNLSISPNPFNTQTEVKFNLLSSAEIELKILNIKGEVVSTLYSGFAPAGQRSVVWNAAELSSGIYFVSLNLQGNNYIQKVVLVK